MLERWIAESRREIEGQLHATDHWWRVSPALYLVRQQLLPLLQRHVRGRLLDVGCGRMPYRAYLNKFVEGYDGFDIERRSADTRYIGDAHEMADIADNTYDSLISLSVVEHLRWPWIAVAEFARVCKPGGIVIIEVPHLSRYHELPHDYYRFTEYGLGTLAATAGLETVELHRQGGLFGFLGHQFSTILVCSTWRVPLLKWVVFWLNYLVFVRLAILLDRLLGTSKLMPLSVVGIFRRPG